MVTTTNGVQRILKIYHASMMLQLCVHFPPPSRSWVLIDEREVLSKGWCGGFRYPSSRIPYVRTENPLHPVFPACRRLASDAYGMTPRLVCFCNMRATRRLRRSLRSYHEICKQKSEKSELSEAFRTGAKIWHGPSGHTKVKDKKQQLQ